MAERLHFMILYVGSAALAAFLAACMTSPRMAAVSCHAGDWEGVPQCVAEDQSDATAKPSMSSDTANTANTADAPETADSASDDSTMSPLTLAAGF
jgi:hypothetical protein